MIYTSPYNIKPKDAKRHRDYIQKVWAISSTNEVKALKKDMALTYNEVYRQPHLTHEKLTTNEKALQEAYIKERGITQCPTQYHYEVSVRSKLNQHEFMETGHLLTNDILYNMYKERERETRKKAYAMTSEFQERVKRFKKMLKQKARRKAGKVNKQGKRINKRNRKRSIK